MGILLCSSEEALRAAIDTQQNERFVAVLYTGESALATALSVDVDDLIAVDVNGPRLSRLNFDAVSMVVLDFASTELLSSAGRRLVDVLGRLAEESLTLVFIGEATASTGAFLEDGVTAGLNLIPGAVVLPDVQAVPDLRALLTRISGAGLRLLALDGSVSAHFHHEDATVDVAGEGNALLVGFVTGDDGGTTARLQPLEDGMRRGWPT